MAGLQSAAPVAPPEDMAGAAPGAVAPEEEMANVSPEEQALYEEVVARGLELIFEGEDDATAKPREAIVDALDDDNPREALGDLAGTLVFRIVSEAINAGQEISNDVRLQAGSEIFEVLAEVASKAGIFDFVGDDAEFQAAWLLAVDKFRQLMTEAGLLDPNSEEGDLQELKTADEDGRLGEIMAQLGGTV